MCILFSSFLSVCLYITLFCCCCCCHMFLSLFSICLLYNILLCTQFTYSLFAFSNVFLIHSFSLSFSCFQYTSTCFFPTSFHFNLVFLYNFKFLLMICFKAHFSFSCRLIFLPVYTSNGGVSLSFLCQNVTLTLLLRIMLDSINIPIC